MTGSPEHRDPNILVISPPFYSHAKPLSVLSRALADQGAHVTFACIPELQHLTGDGKVEFLSFEAASNRNTGSGSITAQPREDTDRLTSFLKATRQGAVASLSSQARNRREDMLGDPVAILGSIRGLLDRVDPDWCVIDQLSYSVTVALHCLGTPFVSFVAGHPTDIPATAESRFGVPDQWPGEIHVDEAELIGLRSLATDVDRAFTTSMNAVIESCGADVRPIGSAFSFSSSSVRVFNYPEMNSAYPRVEGRDLFIGHCTDCPDRLPAEWSRRIRQSRGRPRVLISFGTFQWVHTDLIRMVGAGIRKAHPEALLVIASGDRSKELSDLADDRTFVSGFVPQRDLLPHLDLIVHHGGNNSFTESLVSSVPALVLPFAADQFAVARDIGDRGLGKVLDPNHLDVDGVVRAVEGALDRATVERVTALARHATSRGPVWAAKRIIDRMGH
jgi:UDP:flavonoid glycosyltransferase YjiC (YdhE family)